MNKEEKEQQQNTNYIQGKLIDVLYAISKRGTLQEKVFGVVVWTAMEAMLKKPDEQNGIDSVLNKLLDIARDNGTIKDHYVDQEDVCLMNMGISNVMGLLDAYTQTDESSPHIYVRMHKELEDSSGVDDVKQKTEYIDSRIQALNEEIVKGNITTDDATKEVEKIIKEANEKFGGSDEIEFLDVTVTHENSLKNRICESLYNVYTEYNTAVMNRYKSDKNDRDNKENYYAINILKALMIVHRLSMTREMAEHMYEHNDFYHLITNKINEIAKRSGVSLEEFFRVKKMTPEEIEELEKEVMNDPDVDQNIKDLLGGINFN